MGSDAEDALGHLIGTTIGDAYGVGGLGVVGTGEGGGGTHEGTMAGGGLGTLGRFGGGTGTARAGPYGTGVGHARDGTSRASRRPPRPSARVRGIARQGDHPAHRPPPHQRGPLLLRAGARRAPGPRRRAWSSSSRSRRPGACWRRCSRARRWAWPRSTPAWSTRSSAGSSPQPPRRRPGDRLLPVPAHARGRLTGVGLPARSVAPAARLRQLRNTHPVSGLTRAKQIRALELGTAFALNAGT